MKVDVLMPKMGESITEGTLIKWYKNKGDQVEKDEIIFEISTDKVDTEIPSPESGVLVDIKVFENETVDVDSIVAVIDTNGDAASIDEEGTAETEEKEVPSTHQVGQSVDIPMPKMGESVTEGTIIKWHKKVGDEVKIDEIIFEISTDKVDTEVPSPVDGIVSEILFAENDTVDVDTVVARINSSSGIVKIEDSGKAAQKAEVKEKPKPAPAARPRFDSGRTNKFYSPLVLNIANKEGITLEELEKLPGSGLNGRVTKKDVLNYLTERKAGKVNLTEEYPVPPVETVPEKSYEGSTDRIKIEAMDNIRSKIKHHMIHSRDTSVHVSAMMEVDMSSIHSFINLNKENYLKSDGVKLTYMAFIAHSCVKALKEFPYMNASLEGNNILLKNYVNLGIAVALEPNGLIVPNIKDAEEKSILGLAKSIGEIGKNARTKKLVPDDVMDGTFSITNYGVFGSLFGTPIINQPEVGILGVGAVQKKPVVIENNGIESIAIRPMMFLSLSHDHRLVDGMLGGKFLQSVKNRLESFDAKML